MSVSVETSQAAADVAAVPAPLDAKPAQTSTASRSLLAPVAGVTGILLACKLAGFSEKIVVAHYLGTSRQADAYYTAFAVVWMVVFIVRELVQPAFMPVYVHSLQAHRDLSRKLIGGVVCLLVAVSAGLALVLALFPTSVIWLAAPGFELAVQRETGGLLRSMSAGAAGLTLMGLTHVILNAHRRFCWAAVGDLVFRMTFVGSLIGGFIVLGGNRAGLALGLGAFGGLALHVVVVSRHTWPRWMSLDRPTREALGQMLALSAPLVVGVLCSHLGQMLDGVLASTLAPGRVSALAYARKLTDAIVLLGPVALGTVLFSHFSSLATAGRVQEMRQMLLWSARVVLAVSLPISVLLVILREPLVGLLFQHGRFSAQSTQLTAAAFAGYGVGLAAFALDGIVVSSFYAIRDMKTPVLLGICGVLIELSIAWGLMPRLDHLAIALGASISKVLKVAALWWLLMRKLEAISVPLAACPPVQTPAGKPPVPRKTPAAE